MDTIYWSEDSIGEYPDDWTEEDVEAIVDSANSQIDQYIEINDLDSDDDNDAEEIQNFSDKLFEAWCSTDGDCKIVPNLLGDDIEDRLSQKYEAEAEVEYKGYTILRSPVTTDSDGNPLYEIIGLKELGRRPLITTVRSAKEYIDDHTCE